MSEQQAPVQEEKDVRDRPVHFTANTPWEQQWGMERIMSRAEAFELIDRAKGKTPADWLSWTHLATALHITGDSQAGLAHAMQAVRLHKSSLTLLNLAVILETFGRYQEALRAAFMAHELDPNDQFAGLLYAQARLRQGHWQEAWPLFEKYCWGRIWEVGLGQYIPQWAGQLLNGKKILIVQGGGFGDNLMFMRWLGNLKTTGAHITYACPDVMVPLLKGHPWIDEILPTHEDESTGGLPEVDLKIGTLKEQQLLGIPQAEAYAEKTYDYFAPIMSLARRCHATVERTEEISKKFHPYITAEKRLCNWTLPAAKINRRMIGICWSGAEKLDPRRHRSLDREQAIKLLEAAGKRFPLVNLQYGVEFPCSDDGKVFIQPEMKNWRDTAEIIAHLDLVITVDTGVMHLAGAMGKPTWVMLPGLSDWKFLLGRNDSPFYPSLRLFRNRGEGLSDALEQVIAAIQTF